MTAAGPRACLDNSAGGSWLGPEPLFLLLPVLVSSSASPAPGRQEFGVSCLSNLCPEHSRNSRNVYQKERMKEGGGRKAQLRVW